MLFPPIRAGLCGRLGRIFLIVYLVSLDYLLNELVANYVRSGELTDGYILNAVKNLHCYLQAADLVLRQVDLRNVARYNDL